MSDPFQIEELPGFADPCKEPDPEGAGSGGGCGQRGVGAAVFGDRQRDSFAAENRVGAPRLLAAGEVPEMQGLSPRNLKYMRACAEA